jgi:hypothetical protein
VLPWEFNDGKWGVRVTWITAAEQKQENKKNQSNVS